MSNLSRSSFVVIINGKVAFRSNDPRAATATVKPRGPGRPFVEFRFQDRRPAGARRGTKGGASCR